MFVFSVPVVHARIYKWVDENGVTQYSQQKPHAKTTEKLKLHKQPRSVKTAEEIFQEKEKQRRLEVERDNALIKKMPAQKKKSKRPPKSVTGGISDGSAASNCALARDVLNGSLRHSNGAPMDANDIKVAKRDVKKYCD